MVTTESKIYQEQKLQCYHCGNPCSNKIEVEGQYFCCTGCKTVFEILSYNNLDEYYDYENMPGISMLNRESEKYHFLDNEAIVSSLLDFQSTDLSKVTFYIPGIHCSSCIWLLENLHKLNGGVKESRVNFLKKKASVSFDPQKITLHQLADLLNSIGYGPLINWDSSEKAKSSTSFGSLQIKLGVAGFCFGNIMLLSFPEYFGFEIADSDFSIFFSFLNLFLALPVLIYSGSDYLRSALKSIQQRYINIDVPIALGIITLFLRSAYEVLSQTGPGFFDSFTGFIFFLLIGKWFQDKTYEHLSFERNFKSYFPLAVTRISGDDRETVQVKDLRNGDIVKIRNNEIVPTDCVLLSGTTDIDYSFVTGEQMPVKIIKGETIFAGGRQKGREIVLEVAKPVSQSYLTSLWNNSGEKEELNSQKFIDKIARHFTFIVLVIAIVTGFFWAVNDSTKIWESVTAVLIVACPCALALSVPFTYGNILRVSGRNRLFLKSAEVIEKFHRLDTIIFDKTGTLTWPDKGEVSYHGFPLTTRDQTILKSITSASFHPLSKKLYNSLPDKLETADFSDFEEIPGKGIQANAGGNIYRIGNPEYAGTPEGFFAGENSVVVININGNPQGWYQIQSSYRDQLRKVIQSLSSNYDLGLLSGDRATDQDRLSNIFPEHSKLQFGLHPNEKRDFILKLINNDHKVMMLGDGLNDAAALAGATVGIAVTDDISSFTPACDAIFDGSNFSKFDQLLRLVRSSRSIVIGSFILSFLYNIIGLSFAVTGNLTPIFAAILMPLSSITVLMYTTIAVNISAKLKGVQ